MEGMVIMEKIAITKLAKEAGVSTTSVSRYLKNENVRKDIAEKIKLAIEKTGFTQEMNNKGTQEKVVKEAKNYKFAILTDDMTTPRTRKTIKALQGAFYEYGCTFAVYVTENNPALEKVYIESILKESNQAIIVESCSNPMTIQELIGSASIACLYLNDREANINSICVDEEKAGESLGTYLLSQRHLLIRYLGVQENVANAHMAGIKKVYHDKKQPGDFAISLCDGTYLDIYDKVKEIFSEKIDLLILERDEMAIPVSKYLQEYHICVPQNTSIISFGGHAMVKVMSPTITSLAYDYNTYASAATQVIFALIEGKKVPPMPEIFKIQEGESVR